MGKTGALADCAVNASRKFAAVRSQVTIGDVRNASLALAAIST
jgi:hypothetical protein